MNTGCPHPLLANTEQTYYPVNKVYLYQPKRGQRMCRNIKPLYNFDPPVTEDEIHAAALQYVRKVSGFNKPSQVNEAAFAAAVDEIAAANCKTAHRLRNHCPCKKP